MSACGVDDANGSQHERAVMTRKDPPDAARWNPPGPEAHLRDYGYVLLKRRWLIAAIWVTVLAATAIQSLMQTPLYKATAVIQIDRGKINLVREVRAEDNRIGYAEFYATQRRVLMSRTLAARVMDRLDLWSLPLFQLKGGSARAVREQQIDKFLSMMEVTPVGITQLIDVSFLTPDPSLSERLANSLVQENIEAMTESDSGIARSTVSFIREQIEKIRKDVQEREQALQAYRQQQDVVIIDDKEKIVLQKLENLNQQVAEAQGQRTAAEAHYQSIRGADRAALTEVLKDSSIQNLKQLLARAESEYAELAERFKPDWPEMQRQRGAIEQLERRLKKETSEVASKVVAAARVDYDAAVQREKLLQKAVDEQKGQAQQLGTVSADYESIKVGLDNQRQMLQQLLRRETESALNGELDRRLPINVRVVEEATPPLKRSRPNIAWNLELGGLIGILIAVGVAFFLDYWDTGIYTIEDLRRYVPLPYLGMIPRESPRVDPPADVRRLGSGNGRRLPARAQSGHLASRTVLLSGANGEKTILAERFKFLRSSLLFSNPGAPPQTVLVTSAAKGEGKTFVTCNLARSLTELDKKVLLIDGDLRNPKLHRIFQISNKVGLSTVLTGQQGLDNGVICRTPVCGLSVLPAGPISPRPAELLGSKAMAQLLGRCGEEFDFILVDSAPLLPVIDTHFLAAHCAAVLLVTRSGRTSRYAISSSVELLDRVRARITGVVLNDVNLSDYAQYYYYSHYSYEYETYPSQAASH